MNIYYYRVVSISVVNRKNFKNLGKKKRIDQAQNTVRISVGYYLLPHDVDRLSEPVCPASGTRKKRTTAFATGKPSSGTCRQLTGNENRVRPA